MNPTQAVRKAIIPSGGRGTRLYPLSRFHAKELLPIGGKPALQIVIEEAAAAGITEVAVITAGAKPALERYFSRDNVGTPAKTVYEEHLGRLLSQVEIRFIEQPEPLGLGDALTRGRDFVGDEPFAVLLPDNLFARETPLIAELMAVYEKHGGMVLACKLRRQATPESVPINEAPMEYQTLDGQTIRIERIHDKGSPPLAERLAPLGDVRGIGRGLFFPEYLDIIESKRGRLPGELDDIRPLQDYLQSRHMFGYLVEVGHFDVGDFPGYIQAQREYPLALCSLRDA